MPDIRIAPRQSNRLVLALLALLRPVAPAYRTGIVARLAIELVQLQCDADHARFLRMWGDNEGADAIADSWGGEG